MPSIVPAEATRVGKINLVIGELTGVVGDCIQFYMDFLTPGTPAEGAELIISLSPPRAKCHDCGQSFSPSEFDWGCPHCQGNNIKITGGKELFVESIEVE